MGWCQCEIVEFPCRPMGSMTNGIALWGGSLVLVFYKWDCVTHPWKIQGLSWGLALGWEVHTLHWDQNIYKQSKWKDRVLERSVCGLVLLPAFVVAWLVPGVVEVQTSRILAGEHRSQWLQRSFCFVNCNHLIRLVRQRISIFLKMLTLWCFAIVFRESNRST